MLLVKVHTIKYCTFSGKTKCYVNSMELSWFSALLGHKMWSDHHLSQLHCHCMCTFEVLVLYLNISISSYFILLQFTGKYLTFLHYINCKEYFYYFHCWTVILYCSTINGSNLSRVMRFNSYSKCVRLNI